jgi:hypothetical protein
MVFIANDDAFFDAQIVRIQFNQIPTKIAPNGLFFIGYYIKIALQISAFSD